MTEENKGLEFKVEKETINHKKQVEKLTNRIKKLENYNELRRVPRKHRFDPYVYRYTGKII